MGVGWGDYSTVLSSPAHHFGVVLQLLQHHSAAILTVLRRRGQTDRQAHVGE